jgi:hypothetical protein
LWIQRWSLCRMRLKPWCLVHECLCQGKHNIPQSIYLYP